MTLDTVPDESRKKTAYSVTRFPARLCRMDENFVALDALSKMFLLSFVPFFLLFLFPPALSGYVLSPWCSFVCAVAVVFYTVLSASTCFIIRVLVSFVSCLISEFFCFTPLVFFWYVVFLGWRFLSCSRTLYAST